MPSCDALLTLQWNHAEVWSRHPIVRIREFAGAPALGDRKARVAQSRRDRVLHLPRLRDAVAARCFRSGAGRTRSLVVVGAITLVAMTACSTSPSTKYSQTLRVLERLMRAVPVLPGATAFDHAPTRALERPGAGGGPLEHPVARTAWWTAPGTLRSALAWLNAHRPPGASTAPAHSSHIGGDAVHEDTLEYAMIGVQWHKPTIYADRRITISIVRLGDRVAVRADAQASACPAIGCLTLSSHQPNPPAPLQRPNDAGDCGEASEPHGSDPGFVFGLLWPSGEFPAGARVVGYVCVGQTAGWLDAETRGPASVTPHAASLATSPEGVVKLTFSATRAGNTYIQITVGYGAQTNAQQVPCKIVSNGTRWHFARLTYGDNLHLQTLHP